MSKPDDIPADVWVAALNEAAKYVEWLVPKPTEYDQSEHVLAVSFARAILAERERCVAVCLAEAKTFLSPEYASNQPLGSLTERFACDECAAAIRKGGEA